MLRPLPPARFHLEAAAWDLQAATSGFFDADPAAGNGGSSSRPTAQAPAVAANAPGAVADSSSSAPSSAPKNSRIKTFSELVASGGNSTDDDDDDKEGESQNYFAGGEKSGVMMKGAPKDKAGAAPDLVKDILAKAAKQVTTGPPPDDFKKENKPNFFGGAGYRLGSEEEPNSSTPAQPVVQGPSMTPDPSTQVVERHLIFWRNGFSIDDGPLRDYNDPANQELLRAIKSGRAPTALLGVAFGQPVEVKVAHRMEEDYKPPPKKPAAPFTGSGNRLGGVVPGDPAPGSAAMPIPGAFPGSGGASASGAAPAAVAAPTVSVDSSLPVTSLQVRLADGTRMVARFNHTHTVADLHSFVASSRPAGAFRPFVLHTTFPVKEITDMTKTLKDAGLLNAVVVQKLT